MLQRLKKAIQNAWQRVRRRPKQSQDQRDDGWFYVIADEYMDAEEVCPCHEFNIRTGAEILSSFAPGSGLAKIPREKRISYSEYIRRYEELRKAEEAKKQADAS